MFTAAAMLHESMSPASRAVSGTAHVPPVSQRPRVDMVGWANKAAGDTQAACAPTASGTNVTTTPAADAVAAKIVAEVTKKTGGTLRG